MKLLVKKYFTKYNQQYIIDLREYHLGEITIARHQEIGTPKWTEATANWAGCGSQNSKQTDIFIHALTSASFLARCLDQEVDPQIKVIEL